MGAQELSLRRYGSSVFLIGGEYLIGTLFQTRSWRLIHQERAGPFVADLVQRGLATGFLSVEVTVALWFAHARIFLDDVCAEVSFIYQHPLVSKRFEWLLALPASWFSDVWPHRWASCFLSRPSELSISWSWEGASRVEALRVILTLINHSSEGHHAREVCWHFRRSLVIGEDISLIRSLSESCRCRVRFLLHLLAISLSDHL